MEYLVANYVIELEHPLIFKRQDNDTPTFETNLNDYRVSIKFSSTRPSASLDKGERNWTVPYTHIQIKVSRADSPPPSPDPNDSGARNYGLQSEYFKDRMPAYGSVAHDVFGRIIKYFKFKLWQPLLSNLPSYHEVFQNPKWTDENGCVVGKSTVIVVANGLPGSYKPPFGTIKFEKKHDTQFKNALSKPQEISLRDQVLYDAQTAIYSNNYRRAVLELALSIEILVKHSIFGSENKSSLAFEYLEDKGKINIKVLELIDKIAIQIFSESFKNGHPYDYINIDHLFRCRNKVAHRGEIYFKDDTGEMHIADFDCLKKWWKSMQVLVSWLNKVNKKL